MKSRNSWLLLLSLLAVGLCYLELPLTRVPQSSKHVQGKSPACHPELKDGTVPEGTLLEICYLKDVAYVVELYNHDELFKLAVDMTTPISWIKGPNCHTLPEGKKCTRLQRPIRQEIKDELKHIETKITSRKKKHTEDKPASPSNETMNSILGTETVRGTYEKAENIEFWTKDSSKFASFFKLLLVGLFMSDEKDKLPLRQTNFVNASEISTHINQLCDGAISLRFDDASESSFLNEIFAYVGEPDKVVTVYLGDNSSITIGDLSIKNAQEGYAGITWINLGSNKLPLFDQVTIEEEGSEKIKSVELSVQALFTLSASYISFPKKQLAELLKELGSDCVVLPNSFNCVECSSSEHLLKKKLVLEINDTRISLELGDLIRSKKGHKVIFNIRESQPENPYMILGEPVFSKYYTAFHYSKNRIGVALRRVTQLERLFDVITLVRFLTFIFVTGCCFIICFRPIRRLFKTLRMYYRVSETDRRDSDRMGLRYANVEQNPYAEVSNKIQELVSDSHEGL